ncbi:MAG: Hsp20/alpha crystallin family protein [Promethearchaeota archaeon]
MCDEKNFDPRRIHHFHPGQFCGSPNDIARMKHMAGRFMKGFMHQMGSFVPHNIDDLGTEYLITIPLPGRTKEDVKVSLINKNINVEAKKPKVHEKDGKEEKEKQEYFCGVPFPMSGFKFIDVNMDIPLPADADEDSVSSKMANGLLRITVVKKAAKNINISEEENN